MRKLLRAMAKAEMERRGYSKVNRRMAYGRWRDVIGAYPGFQGSKTPYKVILNRYEAIRWALDHLQPGDTLVLAGKGHEDYQVLKDETIWFDEREIVRRMLAQSRPS